MQSFIQQGPKLNNQFSNDLVLKNYLSQTLDTETLNAIYDDLNNMGQMAANELIELAKKAEENPPTLTQYSPWGERIDKINVCDAWNQLNQISAQQGLVSIGYERKQGQHSRTYQFAKLYLFHPSSAIYTCPLAMTDGAAKLIETLGEEELLQGAFKNLTSRNPDQFWTSGQWMTEKTGGSDVKTCQTIAKKSGDQWQLSGIKWFSSATTSQMAMTLAHEETLDGPLSLFYLEVHKTDGTLNNIEILRLKNKLGTKALPTAELKLNGTTAKRIGKSGKGIKNISHLINVTRIHNSLCAVAYMKRIITLSTDYSKKRIAFGKKLIDHSLHRQTLFECQTEFIGCFHLAFKCIELLGANENGLGDSSSEKLLRVLTPLAKLYTAKRGVQVVSEMLESFGGAGYIEDTGLPSILRDAQVLSIWEGTTNVLSLDVLRSILKEDTLKSFFDDIDSISQLRKNNIKQDEILEKATKELKSLAKQILNDPTSLETKARDFSFALSHVYIGWLLRKSIEDTSDQKLQEVYQKTYHMWLARFENKLIKSQQQYQICTEDLIC